MTIDYAAAAQWGLVPALGAVMTITVTLSYYIFYSKIIDKEMDIKMKISANLGKRVGEFSNISKPTLKDEKEFSEDVERIVEFKDILEKGKELFRKYLLISAIVLLVLGIVFIVWDSKKEIVFFSGIISLIVHLGTWNSLRMKHGKLEKFLNGVDPKEILED